MDQQLLVHIPAISARAPVRCTLSFQAGLAIFWLVIITLLVGMICPHCGLIHISVLTRVVELLYLGSLASCTFGLFLSQLNADSLS